MQCELVLSAGPGPRFEEQLVDAKGYASEASLYYKKSASSQQKTLVFRHFARACEAIRFEVEDLDPRVLQG